MLSKFSFCHCFSLTASDLKVVNAVKNLANVSFKVPARDPSSLRSVRMTNIADFALLDNCYIIS